MASTNLSRRKSILLLRYDEILSIRDAHNRILSYSVLFLFFHRDYFISKLISKLMLNGKKELSFSILRKTLFLLKSFFGFQPFFVFKFSVFQMRQLFKLQSKLIRKVKLYTLPLLLNRENQITYGINHVLKSARQLCASDKIPLSTSLFIIFLNCFIKYKKKKVFV